VHAYICGKLSTLSLAQSGLGPNLEPVVGYQQCNLERSTRTRWPHDISRHKCTVIYM